jgi:uroporphyrin-III C-methyltransferase/precorrin-2 dehydrogenase/sirohydrochlorin ferrochelatase
VAGYLKGNRLEHDWAAFNNPTETLVFYMGLEGLPEICRQLQRHGRRPDTPAALIERGTLAGQRVLTGTLKTLPDVVAAAVPRAPTLIIVGDVVRLHGDLAWFGEE